MTIYEKAIATLPADCIDHHESDLYIKRTPASKRLIDEYKYSRSVETFCSPIDNCIWFDVPFAYDPYWNQKTNKMEARSHENTHY